MEGRIGYVAEFQAFRSHLGLLPALTDKIMRSNDRSVALISETVFVVYHSMGGYS